jgi:TPR repeat protein
MDIKNIGKTFFHSFQNFATFKANNLKTNAIITIKILSIAIPLAFVITYGISFLIGRIKKQNTPVNLDKNKHLAMKIQADQGNIDAQFNLGFMYEKGQGVAQSDQDAAKYYKLTADQGHAIAQFNLGDMYENGRGVTQSDQDAAKYYKLAADQDHAIAQFNLGFMYEQGRGIPQNDLNACKYYKLAADQGHAVAQCILGFMYEHGR